MSQSEPYKTFRVESETVFIPEYLDNPWMNLYAAIAEKAVYDYKRMYYLVVKKRIHGKKLSDAKREMKKIEQYLLYDNPFTCEIGGSIISQIKKTAIKEGEERDERIRKRKEKEKLKKKQKEENVS
jgi:hypothetical protein